MGAIEASLQQVQDRAEDTGSGRSRRADCGSLRGRGPCEAIRPAGHHGLARGRREGRDADRRHARDRGGAGPPTRHRRRPRGTPARGQGRRHRRTPEEPRHDRLRRRRDQRCPGARRGGCRTCHRHGDRHRNRGGRRGSGIGRSDRRRDGAPHLAADHEQHPPESRLGLRLQRAADPRRRRGALSRLRPAPVTDDRGRGDGPVFGLRRHQCAEAEEGERTGQAEATAHPHMEARPA